MGVAERRNPFGQWKRTEGVSPLNLYDQFGRVIQKGDGVILATPEEVIWIVQGVRPQLELKSNETMCLLTLTALYQSSFTGGVPLAGLIKCVDALETGRGEQPADEAQKVAERPADTRDHP